MATHSDPDFRSKIEKATIDVDRIIYESLMRNETAEQALAELHAAGAKHETLDSVLDKAQVISDLLAKWLPE